jgi:hypothetical protein
LSVPEPSSRPVQAPAAFAAEDAARADVLIDVFGRLAATVVPEAPTDPRRLEKLLALTKGANRIIADGKAAAGARVGDLARAAHYASDKHVRDDPHGPWMRMWSMTAVRLLLAHSAPLLAEHVVSAAVRVRRESAFIGYDHHPGCTYVKPLLSVYAGALDRHLVCWQMPLASGTCYDRDDPSADLERIAEIERELGEPLRAGVGDHLALALSERDECRRLVAAAVAAHPELFLETGLDPATVLERAFADVCVLEALPYGAPVAPVESHRAVLLPGDDDESIAAASASMSGIAYCGQVTDPSPLSWVRVELEPDIAARWGLELDRWSTTFSAVDDDLLLRTETASTGARTEGWRTFGMANTDQRALALAQRAAETWTHACIRRAETDAPPGKVYAKDPAFRLALRAMLRFADAALVSAERQRRAEAFVRENEA